jgi:hypothetical protein
MKSYKYSTKERAERVAKTLGCSGFHYHNEDGERKYMPCKSHDIFKSKVEKSEPEEQEVTELVDADGTWLSSSIPILDPASTGIGTKTTDQIVPAARNPRDPLLRGWYGYYGEGRVREEDMSKAFGWKDTMFMDAKETENHFEKELGLDKDDAEKRTLGQGKEKGRDKKAPKKISKLKNFIDRLILKEKDDNDDIIEDVLFDKKDVSNGDGDINDKKNKEITHLLLRNIRSLKRVAKENGISVKELVDLIKNEQ